MTSSPPEEVPEYRANIDAVSPKPLLYPSPTNIPILERSMDPEFNEQLARSGEDLATLQPHQPEPNNDAIAEAPSPNADPYAEQAGGKANAQAPETAQAEGDGIDDYTNALAREDEDTVDNQDTTTTTTQSLNEPSTAVAPSPSKAALEPVPFEPAMSAAAQSMSPETPVIADPNAIQNSAAAGVDIQALLDNLASTTPTVSVNTQDAAAQPPSAATPSNLASPSSAFGGNPNLPPRPPPQEKATGQPAPPSEDIRNYHKIPSANYRAQTSLPSLVTSASTGMNGLPPPPASNFQQTPQSATQQSPPDTGYRQRDALDRPNDDEESPWGPDIQNKFDAFLTSERAYVTEGQWDKFPLGSRLFIGNLPTEKVTKRDIFHIFYKHGQLAQISIKQAYGFVQFLDADACYRALQTEQGQPLRGRKIHLEISKPQKATSKKNDRDQGRRRSRSPDYSRGNNASRGGIDRYTSGQQPQMSPRDRELNRGRDDYRPRRSPSPQGYGRNRRGGRGRDHDLYDGSRRRSRSPYSRHYRSPSQRRDADDDVPLPRRRPESVPDVQILVLDDLDRGFIAFVERSFHDRGVRCDVLLLSPRLSEVAVIRRQILEGVQAVSRLTRASQSSGKIPLQIFDRSGGVDNVRFEEYSELEPSVCAELVLRAKQTHGSQSHSQYGIPPASSGYGPSQYDYKYSQPPAQQPPPVNNANAAQLLSSLNPQELQKLFAAAGIQQPQASQTPQQQQLGLSPDIAHLLANAGVNGAPPNAQAYGQSPPQSANPQPSSFNPLAGMLGANGGPAAPPAQAAAPQVPGSQPNMQEIMAQLAKYKR